MNNLKKVLLLLIVVCMSTSFFPYCAYADNINIDTTQSLVLTKSKVTIGIGEKYKIKYVTRNIVSTENKYKSSKKKIAKVTSYGNVIGKNEGKTKVTVKDKYGNKASITVTVKKPAKKVKLSKAHCSLGIGESTSLTAKSLKGAAYYKHFSSDNPSIADVDDSGKVTAISQGTARITVTTFNNKTAHCTISVYNAPTSLSFSNNNTNVLKGTAIHLVHIVFNDGEYSNQVNYSSSDNSIASVSSKGQIIAYKCGDVIITATLYNGITAQQTISVINEPNCLSLNKTSTQISYDHSNVTKIVFGLSAQGRNQEAYIITPKDGKYKKTFIMTFAIHGFEDCYKKDGIKLVNEGNKLIRYYANNDDKLKNVRLIIIPCLNPDGTVSGKNNKRACSKAFGRCTSKHIDMNRDFKTSKLRAVETRNLVSLLCKYNPSIFVDYHGWLNCSYGSPTLCTIYDKQLKLGKKHSGDYFTSSGYLYAYVHSKYNCPAALIEYKSPYSISNKRTINAVNKIINKYN